MKKTFVYFCILLWATFASAQDFLYFGWGGEYFDFEDSTKYNHVLIDSTDIWRIMKPDKEILFLPDEFGESAIITDTNQYYSTNIQASFQFKLYFIGGTSIYNIRFWHKYDFNPNVDGGIIETSWDYGATWQNIIFDSIIQTNLWEEGFEQNMYSLSDTIVSFDNQPGFTGLNAEGKVVIISFWSPSGVDIGELDTLLLRFTMKSGTVSDNNEGWLLDEFSFTGTLFNNVADVNNRLKKLSLYPNPASDIVKLKLENEEINCILIYSLSGEIIKEFSGTNSINVKDVNPGVYLILVNRKYTNKLIVK